MTFGILVSFSLPEDRARLVTKRLIFTKRRNGNSIVKIEPRRGLPVKLNHFKANLDCCPTDVEVLIKFLVFIAD